MVVRQDGEVIFGVLSPLVFETDVLPLRSIENMFAIHKRLQTEEYVPTEFKYQIFSFILPVIP